MRSTERTFDAISRKSSVENESKIIDNALKQERLDSNIQDRSQRKEFTNKIFWMLVSFLFVTMVFVFLNALKCIPFEISDTVMVALLTTSSANVVGIFLVVVKYLFKATK